MADEGGGKGGHLTFAMQIGLVRESVTVELEGGDLTLSTLKDIACAFVDRKVGPCALALAHEPLCTAERIGFETIPVQSKNLRKPFRDSCLSDISSDQLIPKWSQSSKMLIHRISTMHSLI